MKNVNYPTISFILLILSLVLSGACLAANQYDLNLNGGANFNINNANNNKMTTPLKNFSPITVPTGQVDLLPIAAPPVTSTVTNCFGGWKNIDIVDPGYSNAAEAKAIHKREGTYIGNVPEGVPDDQPVQTNDIESFLDSYHSYLKDVGVEWGHNPANYVNNSQPVIDKDSKVKKTSQLPAEDKNSVELLASQEKLAIDNQSATKVQQNQPAH